MKKHCWLTLGLMVATVAVAQNNTNSLPAIPAPVGSPAAASAAAPAAPARPAAAAPAAKPKKPAAAPAKVVKLKEPKAALVAGPAEVTVSNLIVRGQAGLKGEVVTHLSKGDTVTVLSQINLDKHAADEPAQWAKIASPTKSHIWVSAKYIDATNKTVLPKKLNLRAGPGENYSVVGILERGATVSEVTTKGGWIEIEAPASTYAFVAAMYLKQVAISPVPPVQPTPTPTPPPTPTPTPTPVPEPPPIVSTVPTPPAPPINPPPAVEPPAPVPAVVETVVPPGPRVVTHEGVVRHVASVITPTEYELYDPTSNVNINFLYTTATNLVLSRYTGMRIKVTGEEGLAERWPDIPVLTIQKILVIETNAVPETIYRSPRQSQRH